MRVLITADTVGGVWRFALELVGGLLEAGDSVALVSFGRSASPAQQTECAKLVAQWEGFRYVSSDVPLEWMQGNERSYESGAEVLAAVAEDFAPDLLHSNQFCFGALPVEIPRVVTAHSDVLSWAQACRDTPLEESRWLSHYCALVQHGLDAADAITAPTRWMLCNLSQHFRVRRQSRVIPNGRALPILSACERRPQAVTAGRLWDEAKDIKLLVSVRSPMPMIVAGESECDGTEATVPDGVELIGALSEEDLLRLFSESAVYVCTSRYEPFGLAPLEAALCGCAIVAREIGSLKEVWGDAALYFHNPKELSDLLSGLHSNPEEMRRAQKRAGEQAHRYSRDAMVLAYRKLYAEMTSVS